MATCSEIRIRVGEDCEWTPKKCWIAHRKELAGLPLNPAHYGQDGARVVECPESSQPSMYRDSEMNGDVAEDKSDADSRGKPAACLPALPRSFLCRDRLRRVPPGGGTPDHCAGAQ